MSYALAIVGGGPAGLSTALHLATLDPALAARTVVLEKARYPRDKICAGAIGARAIDALERIGIDTDLGRAVPAVRIDGFRLSFDRGEVVDVREPGCAWVVRRAAFDAKLAAEAAGRVELRQGFVVRAIERDRDGVTIVGETETIRARAIVGADGITGVVRSAIGFSRGRLRAQAVEVDTERVPIDPPADTISFSFAPRLDGYTWDFPTPLDGRVMMSRGAYVMRDRARPEPRPALAHHLGDRGLSLDDHHARQLAERGFEPDAPMAVPRVLLVGEAAGVDFPTGEGIAQAILHGEAAAYYLSESFAQGRYDFSDWRRRWRTTDEGRFLRRRLLGGRLYFGAARALVSHAVASSPSLWQLLLRRFAGRPNDRITLARAVGELGWAMVSGARTSSRSRGRTPTGCTR